MIKVYCDKCGKEITDNVNKEIEETKAIDLYGEVVAKWRNMLHYCDECKHNDLTCGFKVGDEVITSTGKVGKITSICDCENCEERGFYEPTVETEDGDRIYLTNNDKRVNFRSFYKIGDQVFGNIDKDVLLDDIKSTQQQLTELRDKIAKLYVQLNRVQELKNN
jgi:hypothetical protein